MVVFLTIPVSALDPMFVRQRAPVDAHVAVIEPVDLWFRRGGKGRQAQRGEHGRISAGGARRMGDRRLWSCCMA